MDQALFQPYFPTPAEPGEEWVEWHDVLSSQGRALVRCIPAQAERLPDGEKSLFLDFGRIFALRIVEEPFETLQVSRASLPRTPQGALISPFLFSATSEWVRGLGGFSSDPIYHHILVSWMDRYVELLTSCAQPRVIHEHTVKFTAQTVESFNTTSMPAK
jgi:hypothetical protein